MILGPEYTTLVIGTDDGCYTLEWEPGYCTWNITARGMLGLKVRAIAVDAEARELIVATPGGELLHSDLRYQRARAIKAGAQREVLSLARDPISRHIVAGCRPASIYRIANGNTWQQHDGMARVPGLPPEAGVVALLANPLVLGLDCGGVWAEMPDGAWRQLLATDEGPVLSLSQFPGADWLLIATSARLWELSERAKGHGWAAHPIPAPVGAQECHAACLAGHSASHIVAAWSVADSDVLVYRPCGDTWEPTMGASDALRRGRPTVMVRSDGHPGLLFLGTDGGDLLASEDAGGSWQTLASDLAPVRAIAAL